MEDINTYAKLEEDPVLIGVVALRDPPRLEVKDSILKCKEAGISVIMITGDIKETAESIAKDVGILRDTDNLKERSFTGNEFESMKEAD